MTPSSGSGQAALLRELASICGESAVVTDQSEMATYLEDWRGAYRGNALAVVRPVNAEQTSGCIRACAIAGAVIVPQGGNTGLAAGATPVGLERAVVLSTNRMRRIRSIDATGFAIAVDAGCVLAHVQQAAAEAGRLFPLSLAAEGSAQIGGLIATNAGGTAVLRYGSMRSFVLGLEVVLADGSVLDGMRALRKDNAGYQWRELFIGSEGTLGIITGAVLRLFPRPAGQVVALLGIDDLASVIDAFARVQEELGDVVVAAELFSDLAVALRLEHEPQLARPMQRHAWYLLIEAASSLPGLSDGVEHALEGCLEAGYASDVLVAQSSSQAQSLWGWRETITENERRAGRSAKHDVSVPISAIPSFIDEATRAVHTSFPQSRVLAFGHVGDGNMHFNVLLGGSATAAEVNRAVHEIVRAHRGSITAEHGIGRYRRDELAAHRSAAEMALMGAIKRALDPKRIMNPGAVL
jgi:FAD/FMN-containing dehydrogenase